MSIVEQRREQIFPTLNEKQIQTAKRYGKVEHFSRGDILFSAGDQYIDFFICLSADIAIVKPGNDITEFITVHTRGQFTGEINQFSARKSIVRAHIHKEGDVLRLDALAFNQLSAEHSDMNEIFMRAFILRRTSLIEGGLSNLLILGSSYSPDTLRIRRFLSRNGHPFKYIDVDTDEAAEGLLHQADFTAKDVPIVGCIDSNQYFHNPSNASLAECLGLRTSIDESEVFDVAVVGAGPGGLAAAVYSASEGLNVVVLEREAPGGQAGTSSKIENYLGFPTGISGQALAGRAFTQAQKFGAKLMVPAIVQSVDCAAQPFTITLDNGEVVSTNSIVVATGAQYRKLPISNLDRFEGHNVHYAATPMEANICSDQEVVVVGGGNSAGQAAIFLASHARHVHIVIRKDSLSHSMSQYLISRINVTPNITVHPHTEVMQLLGEERINSIHCTCNGSEKIFNATHLFIFAGAVPATDWLNDCVAQDKHGFILTGTDLDSDLLRAHKWPLERRPSMLETSVPGIFAVGDVRSGSTKRVASSVGEGSMAISFVHQHLAAAV